MRREGCARGRQRREHSWRRRCRSCCRPRSPKPSGERALTAREHRRLAWMCEAIRRRGGGCVARVARAAWCRCCGGIVGALRDRMDPIDCRRATQRVARREVARTRTQQPCSQQRRRGEMEVTRVGLAGVAGPATETRRVRATQAAHAQPRECMAGKARPAQQRHRQQRDRHRRIAADRRIAPLANCTVEALNGARIQRRRALAVDRELRHSATPPTTTSPASLHTSDVANDDVSGVNERFT